MNFRRATHADLDAIVNLLADDELGAARENPGDPAYIAAFEAIDTDPNQELIVAEGDGAVIAILQLTIIPNLTYTGRPRALIEGVRVAANQRGEGVGRAIFDHAIRRACERGCHLVQLTTDKRRPEAIRFYESLGFEPTHEGMKKRL